LPLQRAAAVGAVAQCRPKVGSAKTGKTGVSDLLRGPTPDRVPAKTGNSTLTPVSKWLTVLQFILADREKAYADTIALLGKDLDARTLREATADAEVYARRYFVKDSYDPPMRRTPFSLDTGYCES